MVAAARSGRARVVGRVRGRAKTIQLIHVGASDLGLIDRALPRSDPDHDRDYRALLRAVTGQESASACTDAQLAALLAEMKRRGFEVRPAARHGRRPSNMTAGDMRTKIEAQLADMGEPWTYAEGILRQQRGLPRGVACPVGSATALELRGLVAALDVEHTKRSLLAEVDVRLLARGHTREWLRSELCLKRGWERSRKALGSALAWLDARGE